MKLLKTIFILFAIYAVVSTPIFAQQKPQIAPADLQSVTRYFDVERNRMTGDGADFLAAEIGRSQFVLLGEYHGSKRIAEFTKAVIPVFAAAGCRTFALEIGPVSAEILGRLSKTADQTASMLNQFNGKHAVVSRNRTFTPIPFFSGVEDAEFLAEARRAGWRLIGLDQEGSFAHEALVDELYRNLDERKRTESKALHDAAVAAIDSIMTRANTENKGHYKPIMDSKEVGDFLKFAAAANVKNKRIVEAIRFTNEIFYMNDTNVRKYYEANSGRIAYMKKNLAEGFRNLRFDTAKDKMLLKMGAVHTGRGFSPLSLFEIGNTLSEIAEFNGNRSLHIEFGSRYSVENGIETDALADEKGFLYRYKAFLQVAKKDRWTVIDLRPLRNIVFYQRKFDLDPIILEIFKNHDLYVIPPTDRDITPNYTLSSK